MSKANPFQLIILAVCIVGTLVGVVVFSFFSSNKNQAQTVAAHVVIWGTADAKQINGVISAINGPSSNSLVPVINATYVEKDPITFDQDLLEALASGNGPDIVLLPLEQVFAEKDKITTIPFANYSESTFKGNFIQEAEQYRVNDGYLALPFSVDPLVLYWNRDIFTAANQPLPPTHWDQVLSLVPILGKSDSNFNIQTSAIALGEYRNVDNAKDILSALFFQAGIPISTVRYDAGKKEDSIMVSFGQVSSPIDFYTQFANPAQKEYTWNRSRPSSLDDFVANNLAMYIGYGSEAKDIQAKNPNLNFGMAPFPEPRTGTTTSSVAIPVTYGKMLGLSILSSSKKQEADLSVINTLTGQDFLKRYAVVSGMPPVRRDLLSNPPSDSFSSTLYASALYSHAWLDPAPGQSQGIFQEMIESVLSGQNTSGEAVAKAEEQFDLIISNKNAN